MSTVRTAITDAAIKRHANQSVRQLHDQAIGHLYLRYHRHRKSGSWYLLTNQRGRKCWRKLGRWPDMPAATVRKDAPRLLADAKGTIETEQTLGQVLSWYLERTRKDRSLSAERRADTVSVIRTHLLCSGGITGLRPSDLTRPILDAELLIPLQQTLKPATVEKVYRVLNTCLNKAATLDVIGSNPLKQFKLSEFLDNRSVPKGSALKPSDASDLFNTISRTTSQAALLATLMVMHGTRINETRLATWRQFDFKGRWWHIPALNTKTRKAHRLPLTDQALAILERYKQDAQTDYLFAGEGGPMSRRQAYRLIRSISKGEWASHDLRKFARTTWADMGIDYMISELLLNHTPSKIDRTYIHTFADERTRQALEDYHQWLESQSIDFARMVDRW